jgi:hypothetical protein
MIRSSMRLLPVILVAALAVSLQGCGGLIGRGGTSRDYRITTNQTIYSRGNTGEVTIRNVSDETLEYNLCPRRLERQANKYWIVAFEWPTAGSSCTAEGRRLGKGEAINALFDIPTGVPTGTYRVVFTGLVDQKARPLSGDDAATPKFEVR